MLKTWTSHTSCLPHGELEDKALSQERAFITRGLRDFGGTSGLRSLASTMMSFTLEEDGLLDISDVVHLFGVHYIFVPRLRADLDTFTEGWNNHPLRTEGGLTPEQLWCMGHLQDLDEGEKLEDLQDAGIDWESAMLQEDSNSTVMVPEIACPLDDEALDELQRAVDPLEHSQSHGRDLYTRFLHCVSSQQ